MMITLFVSLLKFIVTAIVCAIIIGIIAALVFRLHGRYRCRKFVKERNIVTVAFFHPYCNAGGGGERVLWTAIKSLQSSYSTLSCLVYTGDNRASKVQIMQKVKERFDINLPRDVELVYLNCRGLVEASYYPIFTMLGQSIGSVVLAMEALWKFVPDIYIDTMGYAFTIPLFRYVGGSQVSAYVHYPTISTDMLEVVHSRQSSHNNKPVISRSWLFSYLKLQYYRLFAAMYGLAGRQCSVVMVNSTWTYNHIIDLWRIPKLTHVVYPPCDTQKFLSIPLSSHNFDDCRIVYLAQFRPEKNHELVIRALAAIPDKEVLNHLCLVLLGSCRNDEDQQRVEYLHSLAETLGVAKFVEFKLNVSFTELLSELSTATIGIHAMWNEHFGIGVVECMAAGTIVLAHNSGGPQLDIIRNEPGVPHGFLAESVDSYAKCIKYIASLSKEKKLDIVRAARESVSRFSEQVFEKKFVELFDNNLMKRNMNN